MTKLAPVLGFAFLMACGTPKPTTPSLTPELAAQLLHFDHKAEDWLTYVKKHNPSCEYRIDIPDQSAHPTEIDASHIVWCGNRPSPLEFDASVVFTYDKDAQRWTISRFSS